MIEIQKLSTIALGVALLPFGYADKTYKLNRSCDTDKGLKLTRVVFSTKKTALTLTYTNLGASPVDICTPPPGHREAFFILDPTTNRKFGLTDVEKIAIKPAQSTIQSKRSLTFTLTFEALPMATKRFHLIEGEVEPEGGVTSWRFMNVRF